jgi:hypothetical protein
MNIGTITKIANAIRRAVAEQFNCKPGKISWKLCFNAARKGGNGITVVNAAIANRDFMRRLIDSVEKTCLYRCVVNGRAIHTMYGNSRESVFNALKNMLPASVDILVVPVITLS